MTLFQEFIIRKQIDKLAKVCYEANVDLRPFLNELENQDSYSEESLSRLAETIAEAIGNAIGAAGGGFNASSNTGNGTNQRYQTANAQQTTPQQTAANAQQTTPQQTAANARQTTPQQTAANARQTTPQQTAAKTKAIQTIKDQLNNLSQVIPQLNQQLQVLGNM